MHELDVAKSHHLYIIIFRAPFDENYTKVPFDIEEDSDAI